MVGYQVRFPEIKKVYDIRANILEGYLDKSKLDVICGNTCDTLVFKDDEYVSSYELEHGSEWVSGGFNFEELMFPEEVQCIAKVIVYSRDIVFGETVVILNEQKLLAVGLDVFKGRIVTRHDKSKSVRCSFPVDRLSGHGYFTKADMIKIMGAEKCAEVLNMF